MKKSVLFLLALFLSAVSWQSYAQTYCTSSGGSTTYEYITNVKYAGIDNTTSNDAGYNDFTTQVASVDAGGTNQMSVTINAEGSDFVYAFIDWNQNGTLDDPGEVYTIVSSTSSNGPHTLSLAVPANAIAGDTRMRVSVMWNTSTPTPCGAFSYGEVEDYTVNVTIPACVAPSALAVTPTSVNTANVSWTASPSSPIGYEYAVTTSATPPAAGTATANTTISGVAIQSSVENFLHVRSNCDANGFSGWATYSFMAPTPGQIGALELAASLPINSCNNYSYSQQLYFADELDVALEGGTNYISKIRFYYQTASTPNTNWNNWTVYMANTSKTEFTSASDWVAGNQLTQVFSGALTIPAAGNWMEITLNPGFNWDGTSNLVIAIDENVSGYNCTAGFGAFNDTSEVGRSLIHTSDGVNADPNSPPTATGWYFTVNTLQLETSAPPSCLAPTAIAVTGKTPNTADITWTAGGSETNWNISWGAPGYTPEVGDIGSDISSTPSYQITGLTPNTNYQVYVQADCGSGMSIWSGPITVYTGYCASVPTSNDNNGITNVQVGSTNFAGSDVTYLDFTGQSAVDLAAGVNSNVQITFDTGYTYDTHIWVDLNDNLTFEPSEKLFTGVSTNGRPTTLDASFPMPANAPMGVHRMRIGTADSGQATPNPCYSGGYGITVDLNINVTAPPSCLPPTALVTDSVATTTANISWTAGATESSWNIVWGVPGFDHEAEVVNVGTSNIESFQITGLNASSNYEYYVQAHCGAGDDSAWVGPKAFATACGAVIAPWTEGFSATIPNCWTQGATNNEPWKFSNSGAGQHIGNAGTITGTTPSGGYFAWVDDSTPDSQGTTLITPPIDVSALTTPELSFYLISHNEGHSNVAFSVDVFDGAAWNNDMFTNNANTTNGGWQEIIVNLSALTITGNIQIRFVVDEPANGDFYDDVAIDDVSIHEQPTCPKPTDLAVAAVTSSSANVTWTDNASTNVYNVKFGAPGFDPNTSGATANGNATGASLTGLTPNTAYEFYARAKCGIGIGATSSPWAGPVAFRTSCIPGTIPFMDGFETGTTDQTALGGCWSQESVAGAGVWTANSSITTNNRTPRTGSFNISLQWSNTDWIFYPLDLTGGTAYELKFYARQNATSGATVDAAFGTANNAAAMTNAIVTSGAVTSGDYQEFSGFFIPATDGVYYIGIKATLNFTPNYISIDDVSVNLAPTCIPPTALATTALGQTTADVAWTAGNTETAWNIAWGAPGFDPEVEIVNIGSSNTESFQITGLTGNTQYVFYVQANCGGGDESPWAGPVSFTTQCSSTSVPYVMDFETATVPALPSCTSRENVGTGNNWVTASYSSGGFTGKVLKYGYNSSNSANAWFYTQGINLVAGTSYQISYRYGNNSTTYSESMKVAYGTTPISTAMTNPLADYPAIQQTGSTVEELIFTVATDGVYYFGFNAYSAQNLLNLYVDEINIIVAPTCPAPTTLATTAVTQNTADIEWTAGGTEASWNIAWGVPSFDPEVETVNVGSSNTESFQITGLDAGAQYQFYVQANCGGDLSLWAGPVSFGTLIANDNLCDAIPLTVGATSAGDAYTTVGATAEPNETLGSCLINGTIQTVWFSFVAPASGNVTVTTDIAGGTLNDTQLTVYEEATDCADLTTLGAQVGCDQDGGGAVGHNWRSIATMTGLSGGATYYVQIDGYGSGTGTFGLEVHDNGFDGFVYNNGTWLPSDPNDDADSNSNIMVVNGVTSFTGDIEVKNITVKSGATLNIEGVLNLFGNIVNNGNLVFVSNANGNGALAAVPATSTITGNATVQRYMQNKRSYRMVSSAVTTANSIHANWQEGASGATNNPNPGFGTHITGSTTGANGFDATVTGNYSIFTVDVAAQQFQAVLNTDVNTLTAGNPYLLFVRGSRAIDLSDDLAAGSTVLRATGTLFKGTNTQSFATTAAGNFAMFGNPYQSAVDLNEVFSIANGSTNLNTGHYYVYDPSLGVHGAYVTVALPLGTNTSGSAANQYLQPGQAAQVSTAAAGASSVVFKETNKAPSEFTTTSRPLTASNMLTVQLYTTDNFNNGGSVHDSFGIIFAEGNDSGLTLADAVKPMNFYENLGIDHQGTYLSLERRAMPQPAEVYPLYTSGYKSEDYTLKLTVDGLENAFLYLSDHFTGTSTLLEAGENSYRFTVDASNGMSIATDRFSIRTEERLGVNNNNLLAGIHLFPNPLNSDKFYINAPRLNGEQLMVSISDISGRMIFEQSLECRANTVTVPMGGNIASGVYMVTLKHGGEAQTYRLIKE